MRLATQDAEAASCHEMLSLHEAPETGVADPNNVAVCPQQFVTKTYLRDHGYARLRLTIPLT
jgi:hypothetical protein